MERWRRSDSTSSDDGEKSHEKTGDPCSDDDQISNVEHDLEDLMGIAGS